MVFFKYRLSWAMEGQDLSQIQSLGQSRLLCEAHFLETGLSLIRSLMGQSYLLC